MPPNPFPVHEAVGPILKCIQEENGAFSFSANTLKANTFLLESVKTLQESDLQGKGEVPSDLQYLLGDFEIGILRSSIEIRAKVETLINLLKALQKAVDDSTRPTPEFLENINLSKYAKTLSDYDTVEDFTHGTAAQFEEIKAELGKLLEKETAPMVHRRKLVREVEKCRTGKERIPKIVDDMQETLREILAFSEKMAGDFPQVLDKIRTAIDTINKNKAKAESDRDWYFWAKWICVGLCVVAAAATAGAAVCVGIGVKAAVAGGTAAVATGGFAYYSHNKRRELSDYLEELEEMKKAMDTIHGHVMKREKEWINGVLGPAKQAGVDQTAVKDQVVTLPSVDEDKENFNKGIAASLETLGTFSKGMTDLKDTANSVLSVLHG